ncbi:hypothetical protein N7481_002488 [Penicillium waksmanii]|uniref:uncharacterized protein n=1 Tax=Penicillium waksmanii TaxID=69791 RepID=UPI0025469BEA|nr:uncharacterized protein N7481_002488 [Penicillium waksmanii]KAJ5995511.1 hypothetical protein N7481_002488 [Penicillium waksmanii]
MSAHNRHSIQNAQKRPSQRLLGSRAPQSSGNELSWTSFLKLEDDTWLYDQLLFGSKTFPVAGYVVMAGECMRQLSESNLEFFSVKDLSISSALVFDSDDKLELHTKLRPQGLNEENKQWYDIEIYSHNGGRSIGLCTGLVAREAALDTEMPQNLTLNGDSHRPVSSDYWYDMMADRGIEYGASQRGLSDISVDFTEKKASATIMPMLDTTNSVVHPVFIDHCLQVSMIAACKGQGRLLADLSVITSIQHLVVSNDTWGKLRVNGVVNPGHSQVSTCKISALNESGLPILSGQCKITPIHDLERQSGRELYSFINWDTDSTYHNLNQFLAPFQSDLDPAVALERLALLYALRSEDIGAQSQTYPKRILKMVGTRRKGEIRSTHKNPKLKVLEFGSGTKDTTNRVLKALRTQFDEPLYFSYLSASTSLPKESLRGNGNAQPLFFDAEKSIEEQGLKAGTYDLIIITDFEALASNATIGVKSLKQLIHPQGHVVLLEGVPEPEWLLVLKDYLAEESPNASTGSKTKSSFEDVYAALTENDFVFGNHDNTSTSAPKVFAQLKQCVPESSSEITVIGPAYHLPLIREVEKTFGDHNIKCLKSTIDEDIPPSRDIMVFVDFDEPYLYNITEAELSQFVKLVSVMKGKMIWVTPSAQIHCKNPNSSMILGLMRTIRSEFNKDITTVELDTKRTMNVSLSKSLLKIYKGLSRRTKSKDLDYDYEYAIVDGEIKIPRLQWTTAEAEYANLATHSAAHDVGSQNPSPITAMSGDWGGLGRMISTWMVENGARNIIFLSRSAKEGPQTTPFFDELRAQGCTVTPFVGSVTNMSDVEEAIKQATTPIAGVIQMSAVMRDNLMSQMTFDEWQTSVQPKVQGTWNLHHATPSADLDFFLLFSSICGITGQWGQGNYNAANSFLDAFVNYRHGQNLPASVIDIGFMGSIGMAVKSEGLMKNLKRSGYYFLNERHLINALTISLAHSRPGGDRFMHRSQLGLGIRSTKSMATPTCRVAWKKDSRMAISHHFEPIGGIGDHQVKNLLNCAYSTGKD